MEELGQTLRGALDTLKEQPVDELLAFYQSLDFTTDTLAAAYILSVLSGTIVENDPRMYLEAVSAFGHGGVEGGKTEDARLVSGKTVRKIVLGAKTAALECGFPA